MARWVCIGYPDEENAHHGQHTRREEWECQAETRQEAEEKAYQHFWYFHEVGVYEKEG